MNGFKLIIFKMNNKNMFLVTIQVCVCVTLRVFLLGVVCECSGHAEAHVTVFAAVRFLPRV